MEINIEDAVGSIANDLGFGAGTDELPGAGDGVDELVEGAVPEEPPAEEVPAEVTEPTEPAAPVVEPPKTWRKEATEFWGTLPPTVQQEILKREDDIFRGLESYKGQAQLAQQYQTALAPYMPMLQQQGLDPAQYAAQWLAIDTQLASAQPQQKIELLCRVAQAYGVDLRGQLGLEAPYMDPEVARLQQELSSVQSQLSGMTQAQQNAALQQMQATVNEFATNPENKYFDEVGPQVAEIIKMTPGISLAAAYDKACRLNDTVWGKIQAERAKTAENNAQLERARQAKAARRATSVNVNSAPRTGSGTAPTGSIDDTIAETLAAIKANAAQ